jgi:hypothetical protein
MEGHFWREIFFHCADKKELLGLRHLDYFCMSDDEKRIKNVLLVFESFQLHIYHIFKLVAL